MPICTIITVKMCDFVWWSCFDRIFGIFNMLSLEEEQQKKPESLQQKWCALDRLLRCDKSIFKNNFEYFNSRCDLLFIVLIPASLRRVKNRIEHHLERMWTSFGGNGAKKVNETRKTKRKKLRTCKQREQYKFKSNENWICNWLYKMPVFMIIGILVFNMLHFVKKS